MRNSVSLFGNRVFPEMAKVGIQVLTMRSGPSAVGFRLSAFGFRLKATATHDTDLTDSTDYTGRKIAISEPQYHSCDPWAKPPCDPCPVLPLLLAARRLRMPQ